MTNDHIIFNKPQSQNVSHFRRSTIQKPCYDIRPFCSHTNETHIQFAVYLRFIYYMCYLVFGSPSVRLTSLNKKAYTQYNIYTDNVQNHHIGWLGWVVVRGSFFVSLYSVVVWGHRRGVRRRRRASFKFNESIDLLGVSKVGRPKIERQSEFCGGPYI